MCRIGYIASIVGGYAIRPYALLDDLDGRACAGAHGARQLAHLGDMRPPRLPAQQTLPKRGASWHGKDRMLSRRRR